MDWLGTLGAALVAALAGGVTLIIGARIKGEWWPGQLRRAQRLNQLLEDLDADSPTARLLARERDESLQAWALRGRISASRTTGLMMPLVFVGLVFVFLGMAGITVMAVGQLVTQVTRTGTFGLATAAVASFFAGLVLVLASVAVIVVIPDYRWRAMAALRRRFGLSPTIASEAKRVLARTKAARKEARRRARSIHRTARGA